MQAPIDARETRAYEWIRTLSESAERFAGTVTERAVAERIGEWMRGLGVAEVGLEPAPSAPRSGLVLALHSGVALLGLWIGGFLGAGLAALALWSFRSELRHRARRLSRLLAAPDSVN